MLFASGDLTYYESEAAFYLGDEPRGSLRVRNASVSVLPAPSEAGSFEFTLLEDKTARKLHLACDEPEHMHSWIAAFRRLAAPPSGLLSPVAAVPSAQTALLDSGVGRLSFRTRLVLGEAEMTDVRGEGAPGSVHGDGLLHSMSRRPGQATSKQEYWYFNIHTSTNGSHLGLTISFRTENVQKFRSWCSAISRYAKEAADRHQTRSRRAQLQILVRRSHQHPLTRAAFILAICINFICDAIVANSPSSYAEPASGAQLDSLDAFKVMEILFTTCFAIELCWNLASHWFWPFVREGWNWLGK